MFGPLYTVWLVLSTLLTGFCLKKCLVNSKYTSLFNLFTAFRPNGSLCQTNQSVAQILYFIIFIYQIQLSRVVVESGVQGHRVIAFLDHSNIYSILSLYSTSLVDEVLNVLNLPVALEHKSWPIPLKHRHQWSGSKIIH